MSTVIELTERQRGTRCCAPGEAGSLTDEEAQRLASDLEVLAHPIRLRILDLLGAHEGQVCVCDLDSALPVKQPTISHHLKILRAAGLVESERQGAWAYYYIRRKALAALRQRVAARLAGLGA